MSVTWPCVPPHGWWMSTRECGSAKRFLGAPDGEQHGGHRGALTDADGRHVGLDVLHRVVDGQTARDRAARRVDVEADVLLGIGALEVQELRDDQVGDVVVDLRAEEHDAVVEQTRVDVEAALASAGLLDDDRDEGLDVRKHRGYSSVRLGSAAARRRSAASVPSVSVIVPFSSSHLTARCVDDLLANDGEQAVVGPACEHLVDGLADR